MQSPYEGLPSEAFWRTGVVGQQPQRVAKLYRKKFSISPDEPIATAGSCFAQHISRQLRDRGFSVLDREPAPPGLDRESAAMFGYGLFSARYGNIYTARQLLQIVREARGEFRPAEPVWKRNDRFHDAMRPSVEPHGLADPDVVRDHRAYHLRRILEVISSARLFIFTLGLTETWEHAESGTVYPTAPGTVAGEFDPNVYRFRNLTFQDVYDDMRSFFELASGLNPDIRFLLTVSPVPLTATASGEHVLSATTYSKSVLRAVAGQLYHECSNVDYFPSYEIITGSLAGARFFEENLRSIRSDGVDAAMNAFFAEHDPERSFQKQQSMRRKSRQARGARRQSRDAGPVHPSKSVDDLVCEEVLLDAFAK